MKISSFFCWYQWCIFFSIVHVKSWFLIYVLDTLIRARSGSKHYNIDHTFLYMILNDTKKLFVGRLSKIAIGMIFFFRKLQFNLLKTNCMQPHHFVRSYFGSLYSIWQTISFGKHEILY